MSDSVLTESSSVPFSSNTAGGLLRQAREAKSLRLDVLAATIKVTTAKLEALEANRFERLPDATFTRALAQAVCRSLKIDPAPVLALLPPPNGHRLEEVAEGLKTPFNERPGRLVPGQWFKLSAATVWVSALLVLAALLLYLVPPGWITVPRLSSASPASAPEAATPTHEPTPPDAEPTAQDRAATPTGTGQDTPPNGASTTAAPSSAAVLPATPIAGVVPPATTGAAATATSTAAAPSAPAPGAAALQFTTTGPSWIGVTDGAGNSLIGRLVQPGETIALNGAPPLTLRIGHASTVQMRLRGEPFDLKKYIRDDVARLQLK